MKRKEEDKEEKEKLEEEKVEWIGRNTAVNASRSPRNLGTRIKGFYVLEKSWNGIFRLYSRFQRNSIFLKMRVNPSLEALRKIEELIDKGYDAEIVWLISKPTDHIGDEEDYYNRFEPREAIIIWNYLRKYSLYKF